MNRTLFAVAAVIATGLAAVYLIGADGTSTPQSGTAGPMTQKPMTDAQQVMQAPALETVECTEGYILLMPCPVCHTCPVCQANCGTAHALKCCLGNKTPAYNAPAGTTSGSQASGTTAQQHIMTNKAEAVKHAAGRPATMPQPQMDTATMSVIEVESN